MERGCGFDSVEWREVAVLIQWASMCESEVEIETEWKKDRERDR
jgi:hypothetical protein